MADYRDILENIVTLTACEPDVSIPKKLRQEHARQMASLRSLGMRLMHKLEQALQLGGIPEEERWLWGDKEHAVGIWVKLSSHLLKLAEQESKILAQEAQEGEDTPKDMETLSAADDAIIARYLAKADTSHDAQ